MIRKGTYVLFLHFDTDVETRIGALGTHILPAGDYCYVGSAMGGLDQRVSRHLSKSKTIRWHIDNLTVMCDSSYAFESEGTVLPECELAKMMESLGNQPMIPGFGCSDCDCTTHLFRVDAARTKAFLTVRNMHEFYDKRIL